MRRGDGSLGEGWTPQLCCKSDGDAAGRCDSDVQSEGRGLHHPGRRPQLCQPVGDRDDLAQAPHLCTQRAAKNLKFETELTVFGV